VALESLNRHVTVSRPCVVRGHQTGLHGAVPIIACRSLPCAGWDVGVLHIPAMQPMPPDATASAAQQDGLVSFATIRAHVLGRFREGSRMVRGMHGGIVIDRRGSRGVSRRGPYSCEDEQQDDECNCCVCTVAVVSHALPRSNVAQKPLLTVALPDQSLGKPLLTAVASNQTSCKTL